MYSRRINLQHRLFYEIDEQSKRIKVLRYEVIPGQGNNIITIFNFNRNEESGRVIKFNKR